MKQYVFIWFVILMSAYIVKAETKYNSWSPVCKYMNITMHNQYIDIEKCQNMINYIFNESYMRYKLNDANCNPTECIIQLIKCGDTCAKYKILECAECIGNMYINCCDCVLPKHICSE